MFLARAQRADDRLSMGARWVVARDGRACGRWPAVPRASSSAAAPGCAACATPRRRSGSSTPRSPGRCSTTTCDRRATASTRRSSPSPRPTASRSTRCRSRSGRATPAWRQLSLRDVVDFAAQPRPASAGALRRCGPKMRSDQATWAVRSGRMLDQQAAVGSSFGADVELERLADRRPLLRLDRRRARAAPRATASSRSAPASARCRGRLLERRSGRRRSRPSNRPPTCFDELVGAHAAASRGCTRPQRHLDRPAATTIRRRRSTRWSTSTCSSTSATTPPSCAPPTSSSSPAGRWPCSCRRFPRLYGSLDYKSGHHRRYTPRRPARRIAETAGFELVDLRYLDLARRRAVLRDVPRCSTSSRSARSRRRATTG